MCMVKSVGVSYKTGFHKNLEAEERVLYTALRSKLKGRLEDISKFQ